MPYCVNFSSLVLKQFWAAARRHFGLPTNPGIHLWSVLRLSQPAARAEGRLCASDYVTGLGVNIGGRAFRTWYHSLLKCSKGETAMLYDSEHFEGVSECRSLKILELAQPVERLRNDRTGNGDPFRAAARVDSHAARRGTYTISVRNAGSAATTGSVTVTDTLPIGGGGDLGCRLELHTHAAFLCALRRPRLGDGYPPITLAVKIAADSPTSVANTVTVTSGRYGRRDGADDSGHYLADAGRNHLRHDAERDPVECLAQRRGNVCILGGGGARYWMRARTP